MPFERVLMTWLISKQEAQSHRLKSSRLYKAMEALKPKAPVTDKKTAFWHSYKGLADENDKEFLQKYSTELDASLIFNLFIYFGLFSAVSSAFIIQIQSGTTDRVSPIVVVAQSLLYISLFSTLLAALLAVLGKQWLMYYSAAGQRGTIEARGLERQRKLDALRSWKFDTAMEFSPLCCNSHCSSFPLAFRLSWGNNSAQSVTHILPRFSPGQLPVTHYPPLASHGLFGMDFPTPSPEVSPVSWILETSADPDVIAIAANLAVDLQWPVNLDLTSQMTRLQDTFPAWFDIAHDFVGIVTLKNI
ncbi:hypothetical protein FB451DRAFT_1169296 [Mycena latifolia]|nr:hypothetical protein FB451DRAFT_1169296 [Mycena latifolia]